MTTDPAPNDVGLTGDDLSSVLKRRPAIGSPGHLEHARSPFHALHPETRSKLAHAEVGHEQYDSGQERRLLVARECIEIGTKTGQPGKGWHPGVS